MGMDALDTGHLVYLVILGIAVVGWYIAENRAALGRTVRMALAWGFIFLGVVAGYGLWGDIRDDVAPRQAVFQDGARVEVPRAFDGHYYLTLELNGVPVDFIVDTGATDMVLTRADAARIGLDPAGLAYTGIAGTANGQVRTARVRLDAVSLGGITDSNLSASVNAGAMDTSLLGMSYLQRFDRIEIANGRLVLER
jgi:aspartyl protease family protein